MYQPDNYRSKQSMQTLVFKNVQFISSQLGLKVPTNTVGQLLINSWNLVPDNDPNKVDKITNFIISQLIPQPSTPYLYNYQEYEST